MSNTWISCFPASTRKWKEILAVSLLFPARSAGQGPCWAWQLVRVASAACVARRFNTLVRGWVVKNVPDSAFLSAPGGWSTRAQLHFWWFQNCLMNVEKDQVFPPGLKRGVGDWGWDKCGFSEALFLCIRAGPAAVSVKRTLQHWSVRFMLV